MLEQLRWRLTFWFVGLSVLLYSFLSVAVVLVFDIGTTNLLDDELQVVSREVKPALEFPNGTPSLKLWAAKANDRDIDLLATVQLYDKQGRLVEQHGPKGVEKLLSGYATALDSDANMKFRSRSTALNDDKGNYLGALQIQISLRSKDRSIKELLSAICLIAPFLFPALGLIGYFFAGKALKPTEDTMAQLKRFVADAGHEFTTPVSVILASVETLERKNQVSGATSDILPVIRRAGERLAHLANDLLTLARNEIPAPASQVVNVDLKEIVRSIIDELALEAAAKDISINDESVPSLYALCAADSVRTAVLNLVKNAISYTDRGGRVDIGLERLNNNVQVSVTDTGIGIPSDSLEKIFERFYRVDKSRSRSEGGSGLGLAIVKAVADANHGTVKVESTVGVGSKFIFSFPYVKG